LFDVAYNKEVDFFDLYSVIKAYNKLITDLYSILKFSLELIKPQKDMSKTFQNISRF